jgi:uncharacterized membrane protein
MSPRNVRQKCAVCEKEFGDRGLVRGVLIREPIAQLIRQDHPDWSDESYICREDLSRYRANYVHSLLESEKGELTVLEQEVIKSLETHDLISSNVDTEFEREWSFGERLADHIAVFGGSWNFLILFALFLFLWVGINSVVLFWRPIDPYPYILLNLMLSCLAAIQAPIIMMSQNRLEAKDRLRSQQDYQVNLKAELEIRHLHEKIDHLLSHQWERLVQIQEIQIDLLSELRQQK